MNKPYFMCSVMYANGMPMNFMGNSMLGCLWKAWRFGRKYHHGRIVWIRIDEKEW